MTNIIRELWHEHYQLDYNVTICMHILVGNQSQNFSRDQVHRRRNRGGRGGLSPPTLKDGGAEPPHFSNVYTFQYVLHNTTTPQNYCQKASETLSESRKIQIFLGSMPPDPPR